MELFGDEVDSIRSFDLLSQRSIEQMENVRIYPANEILISEEQALSGIKKMEREAKRQEELLRKGMHIEEAHRIKMYASEMHDKVLEFQERSGLDAMLPYFYNETTSLLEYFGSDTIVFLDEPNRIAQEGSAVELEFTESMKHRLEKGYVRPTQTRVRYSTQESSARLNRMNGLGL